MVELKGFYKEQTLQELLYKGNINKLEYIYHHSQKLIDKYKSYCQNNHLQEDDMSADSFMNNLLKQEEMSHTDMLD